jgi:mRNA interferase MazF
MIEIKDGSIVNVQLGAPPKEVIGHEQGFTRPCIVLKHFSKLKLAVVIPCTSKTPPNAYYSIVQLKSGVGGLTIDSYALCHQIRTVSLDRITSIIGQLPPNEFFKIQSVQADILGI